MEGTSSDGGRKDVRTLDKGYVGAREEMIDCLISVCQLGSLAGFLALLSDGRI